MAPETESSSPAANTSDNPIVVDSDVPAMETSNVTDDQQQDLMESQQQQRENEQPSKEIKADASTQQQRSSALQALNEKREVPIVELELENVSYLPMTSTATAKGRSRAKKARTPVLKNISTKIAPYQLTAWMGPSGSGKTSLTSVVAGLVDPTDLSSDGIIKVNGEEGRLPKRLVGVVWQDDLLLSNLTVEETIYFSARLKTPFSISDAEVREIVEETMRELGLSHVRDNLIGSALSNMAGISGGERKRVAVAAELVVRPALLLLDEPTSGLDATTAQQLIITLKELAMLGHSIAVVIHQPRTDIFKMIDHLLLLSKGHVVFNGPASEVRAYLESCPTVEPLPPETGIADWIMDTVIADEKKQERVLARHWEKWNSTVVQKTENRRPLFRRMSTLQELNENRIKFDAPFPKQLSLLVSRTMKQRRGEKLTKTAFLLTFAYMALTSLFWWQLKGDTSDTFQTNSLLFFILIAQGNTIVVSSVSVFQRERNLLRRERAKKMYGVLPYFIAKVLSDMTNNILLPLSYAIVIYFTAGLRLEATAFFKFVFATYLTLSAAQSMGFMLSIAIPNQEIATLLAPPITLFWFIIGGFYIPLKNINVGIKWASYISFARYGYSALMINEYEGRYITCAPGSTAIAIGATGSCPVPGNSVYESMGITGVFANYWFNIAILAVLHVSFLTIAYINLRRSK